MKTNFTLVAATTIAAALFTVVFYKQYIGLNLLMFEAFIFLVLFVFKRFSTTPLALITTASAVLTALMVVIHNTQLAVFANIISMLLMTGVLLYPKSNSLLFSAAFAGMHLPFAPFTYLKALRGLKTKQNSFTRTFKWLKIIALSLLIITLFVVIYKSANPIFNELISGLSIKIDWLFNKVFGNIEGAVVATFVFGLLISCFLIMETKQPLLEKEVNETTDWLHRVKSNLKFTSLNLELKREWKMAAILLIALNLLLLIVNCIDVYWVWFNFEWNGDYLKQFVHEGTYLLIVSILISVAISLYLFRGSLNFYSKNIVVKRLTFLWLAQNIVLAISVGVRNFHYIHYYALAYKRIGVIFFLIATIFGLITVILKIKEMRSLYFLLRINALSAFILFISMSLFNWDVIISKYNFAHANQSFVHFNFLSSMNNSSLPYLDKSFEELKAIEIGNERFPSKIKYLKAELYYKHIQLRKSRFLKNFENEHWLSWNLASQRSYNTLKSGSN